MGIIKAIEKPNGVVFNYHRVNCVIAHTNNQNVIEVASYISKEKRLDEVECFARQRAGDYDASTNTLVDVMPIPCPYDPTMTVDSAYEYLLTLPEFEGAEMEDTEYMLDAIETVPDIEAELAEQQQADIQQPQEEGDVE